jgi:hypothetical protein
MLEVSEIRLKFVKLVFFPEKNPVVKKVPVFFPHAGLRASKTVEQLLFRLASGWLSRRQVLPELHASLHANFAITRRSTRKLGIYTQKYTQIRDLHASIHAKFTFTCSSAMHVKRNDGLSTMKLQPVSSIRTMCCLDARQIPSTIKET